MAFYNFKDLDLLKFSTILSGEIGSGKTSFIIQFLLNAVKNENFKIKNVFINIDGFDFEKFNKLAKDNNLDLEFKWLDMSDLMAFAKIERISYTKFNSSGDGIIAENVMKELDKFDYFKSLIICDEVDNYLSKSHLDFANFMKFRRHYGIGLIFLTQKFQNLHDSFYNSGAINRFYQIENPIFSFGNRKKIILWQSADTRNDENRVDTYIYKVDPEVFNYYHTGDNISSGNFLKKKIIIPLVLFLILLPIVGYIFYSMYSDATENSTKSSIKKVQSVVTEQVISNNHVIDNLDYYLVKCISFGSEVNLYLKDNFTSHKIDYISKLNDLNITKIDNIYKYKHIKYIKISKENISYLFFDFKLQKEKK